MRERLQLLLFLLLGSLTWGNAQTNVTLNINHLLGEEPFRLSTTAQNNLGQAFNFSRLEYYLAEISLIHDGGQETMVEDLYLLIDGTFETSVELGMFDVTNLEAIRFHVGVDEARNHLDPSTYDMDHPLAPKFPSMHWGWVSGYRFLAIEGRSGNNLGEIWEIHALDDDNYFQTEVLIERTAVNGQLSIDLDADYVRGLEDIDMNSGPVVHGGFGLAINSLQNYRDYVFTAAESITSTEDLDEAQPTFSLSPNPVVSGQQPLLVVENAKASNYGVQLMNANGQMLGDRLQVEANGRVSLPNLPAGIYLLQIDEAGVFKAVEKLIVQ